MLYKLLLTLNATSWMAIIYVIKEGLTIGKIPSHLFGIMLLIIPIFLSWLSLTLSRFLETESPVVNCKEFNLADGEFLPITWVTSLFLLESRSILQWQSCI